MTNDEILMYFMLTGGILGLIVALINFIMVFTDESSEMEKVVEAGLALIASPFLGILVLTAVLVIFLPSLPFIGLYHLRKLIIKKK